MPLTLHGRSRIGLVVELYESDTLLPHMTHVPQSPVPTKQVSQERSWRLPTELLHKQGVMRLDRVSVGRSDAGQLPFFIFLQSFNFFDKPLLLSQHLLLNLSCFSALSLFPHAFIETPVHFRHDIRFVLCKENFLQS